MTKLEEVLIQTHRDACHRRNSSTITLVSAWESNGGDLIKSITAAMMTLGGEHAPIKRTYNLLRKLGQGSDEVVLNQYEIIPGFGSSFVRGAEDDMLMDIKHELEDRCPEIAALAETIGGYLERKGKKLYPNLAFYTAAVALAEGHGFLFCEKILLEARIPEWVRMLQKMEEGQ